MGLYIQAESLKENITNLFISTFIVFVDKKIRMFLGKNSCLATALLCVIVAIDLIYK